MKKNDEEKSEIMAYEHAILKKNNKFIGLKYKASALYYCLEYLGQLAIQEKRYELKPDGAYVYLKAPDIKREVGSNSGSIYAKLDKIAQMMTATSMGYSNVDLQEFDYITVVNRAQYKNGEFMMRFSLEALEELTSKVTPFTMLEKRIVMQLKRPCSIPLYQLLKSKCYYPANYKGIRNNVFSFEISVSELKLDIGAVDSNHPDIREVLIGSKGLSSDFDKAVHVAEKRKIAMFSEWAEFDRKCLRKSQEEINEVSDIYFEYEGLSKGRGGKIEGVAFTIWLGGKHDNAAEEVESDEKAEQGQKEDTKELSDDEKFVIHMEVYNMMKDFGLGIRDIENLCISAGYDIERIKKGKALLEAQKTTVNNVVGWLRSYLEHPEKYVENVEYKPENKAGGNKFNNFHQRELSKEDWTELEKQLLNRKN